LHFGGIRVTLEVTAHQPHYLKGLNIMASITKLLMDEFDEMRRAALTTDDFARANVFADSEAMVNNIMHGRMPGEVLGRCKRIFVERIEDMDNLDAYEREAYVDSLIIIDLFAEQYGLDLTV
jgi:hypothetical protein